MMQLTPATEDNLVRARMALIELHPFWGELTKYLRPIVSETRTPTACVDKTGQMFINPGFANKATASDLLFVFAHEAMHIVNASYARMPKKDANFALWARAADIAINYLLVNEAHIKLPRKDLIEPLYHGFEQYFNQTHEEIYQHLSHNTRMIKLVLKDTKWCDEESCTCSEMFELDPEEARKWQSRIQNAASLARAVGKLPGSLEPFLAEIGRPKKNWARVLALAAQRELRRRFTWRRPNRRTAAIGVLTPGMEHERPEVVVYVDTSMSMNDELLNEALTEVAEILRVARSTLILGDAEIYYVGKLRREELSKIPMQRGGTDFQVLFERIEKEKLKPQLLIGFTDLDGPFPDKAPGFPVIWCRASTSGTEAPWGQIIQMQ